MGSGGWRWWLRARCQAIADATTGPEGMTVLLCTRWRWHLGPCRHQPPTQRCTCTDHRTPAGGFYWRDPGCPLHGTPRVVPPTGL